VYYILLFLTFHLIFNQSFATLLWQNFIIVLYSLYDEIKISYNAVLLWQSEEKQ